MKKTSKRRIIFLSILILLIGGFAYIYLTGNLTSESVSQVLRPLFEKLPAPLQGLNPFPSQKDPVQIVVVFPDSQGNTYAEVNNVIRLFQQKHENINGSPLEIRVVTDNSEEQARQAASQIVSDKKALVVIGHRFSETSLAAIPIYAEAGIPVISPFASVPEITTNNDWTFRIINNTTVFGEYAALYSREVLRSENASIVYLNNTFGESMRSSFKTVFEERGGSIHEYKMSPNGSLEVSAQEAEEIVQQLRQDAEAGIVFLILNQNEAEAFIRAMRRLGGNFPMIGTYGLADPRFADRFEGALSTDGMYAFSPLIYDVSGKLAKDFNDAYLGEFKNEPSWLGAATYDSLLIAIHAIEQVGATGQPNALAKERQAIRDFLAEIDRPADAIEGLSGRIYFDQERNFPEPPAFGVFNDKKLITAPIQLRPIPDKRLIPDVSKAIIEGQVIANGQKYFYKTNVVYTGIRLIDISDVDMDRNHTFTADFYLWFNYQGDLKVESIEAIEFINSVAPIQLNAPVSSYSGENTNYRLYRVRAQFRADVDLQNYPFDHQELAIKFRHRNLTRERLIYVEDSLRMDKAASDEALMDHFNEDNVFSTVSDWTAEEARVYIDTYSNKSSLGNPAWIGTGQNVENSRFNIIIDIQRKSARFVLKNMLPLFCLVLLAYLSLFLPGYKFDTITGIMTGAVLSIVFFHVNLSSRLNVGYNVALDYVFFATYLLLILELLLSIIAWHNEQEKDERRARGLMTWARVIYPVYLISVGALLIWLYTNPKGVLVLEYLKTKIPGL